MNTLKSKNASKRNLSIINSKGKNLYYYIDESFEFSITKYNGLNKFIFKGFGDYHNANFIDDFMQHRPVKIVNLRNNVLFELEHYSVEIILKLTDRISDIPISNIEQ